MKPRWNRIRNVVVNTAVVLAALLCAFALGELAARLLFKEAAVLFPRYHTDYQYGRYTLRGVRPHAEFWHTSVEGSWKFVTNNKGFRNHTDFEYAKPPGTLRILSLGDSHTQGYEVRQEFTYSAVAERYLRQRNVSAEAINAGVSGYSTAEALAFLEGEGHRYQPDVVVLGFYANDFEDNLKAGLFVLDAQNRLQARKYAHIPGVRIQNVIYSVAPVRWLSENSYFYSLLFNSVWNYFKQRLADAALEGAQASGLEYAVASASGVPEAQVSLAARLIERMQRFCSERGIRLIVVDIPTHTGAYRYATSLVPALLERLNAAGIETVTSASLLAHYDGVAEIHRLHGHQHISEFTHVLIGSELGRRLLQK